MKANNNERSFNISFNTQICVVLKVTKWLPYRLLKNCKNCNCNFYGHVLYQVKANTTRRGHHFRSYQVHRLLKFSMFSKWPTNVVFFQKNSKNKLTNSCA